MRDRTKELEKLKKQLARLQGSKADFPNEESEIDDVCAEDDAKARPYQQSFDAGLPPHGHSTAGPSTYWEEDGWSHTSLMPTSSAYPLHPAFPNRKPPDMMVLPETPSSHTNSTRRVTRSHSRASSARSAPIFASGSPESMPSPDMSRRPSLPMCQLTSPAMTHVPVCVPVWEAGVAAPADVFLNNTSCYWPAPAASGICTPPGSSTSSSYPSCWPAAASTTSPRQETAEPAWPIDPCLAQNTGIHQASAVPPPPPLPPHTRRGEERGPSLIHLAVAGNNVDVLRVLLGRGDAIAALELRDSGGCTALQRAMMAGQVDIVRMLLAAGANLGPVWKEDTG
jgi:hypothetical protein